MRRRKCSQALMSVGANSLLVLALVQVASGQLGISENEVQPLNMPQITRLDVDCAKSGMTVNIEFSAPFNGVIFSKGFYANPSCRYVRSNSGSAGYTFTISMTDCGTSTYDDAGTLGFENTIIIQMEEIVQEAWDTARRISCDWKSTFEKEVVFNPIQVGMLNVEEVRFSGDKVECWMDIKRGNTPFGSAIDGILEIGEELTVVIYAADGGSNFDILVKNCVAYDDVDYNGTETTRLPLTDDRGCLLKEKLMGYFRRTYDTKQTGASIIAYARLNAFKFPDKMGVFLTCDVELCKDGCKDFCDDPGYPSEPEGVLLLPDRVSSTTQRVIATTTTPRPEILPPCELNPTGPGCVVECFPGSPDPNCQPPPEPEIRDKCEINPDDPECQPIIPVEPLPCQPGSNDPACLPDCFPGSNDPRCPPPPPPRPVETTTRSFCELNPNDRRCFSCVPGSNDPRCPTQPPPPPPTRPPPPPPTRPPPPPPTRPPPPPPTPGALVCGPNSNDPRCPFSCDLYPSDPRCSRPIQVTAAPSTGVGTGHQQVGHYGNKDPMYHSFHKWMYEPAPSRFTRRVAMAPVRRKREVEVLSKNATISFTHGFAVLSVADLAGSQGDSVHYFESHKKTDHLCLNPDSLVLLLCLFVGVILLTVLMTVCQMRRILSNRQKCNV